MTYRRQIGDKFWGVMGFVLRQQNIFHALNLLDRIDVLDVLHVPAKLRLNSSSNSWFYEVVPNVLCSLYSLRNYATSEPLSSQGIHFSKRFLPRCFKNTKAKKRKYERAWNSFLSTIALFAGNLNRQLEVS